jgi:hypothetical protein
VDLGFIITMCPVSSALFGWSCLISEITPPNTTTRPICRYRGVADQRPRDDMGHHVPFIYDRGVLHYVVVYHCFYSFRRPIARIGQQVGMPIVRIEQQVGSTHDFCLSRH